MSCETSTYKLTIKQGYTRTFEVRIYSLDGGTSPNPIDLSTFDLFFYWGPAVSQITKTRPEITTTLEPIDVSGTTITTTIVRIPITLADSHTFPAGSFQSFELEARPMGQTAIQERILSGHIFTEAGINGDL